MSEGVHRSRPDVMTMSAGVVTAGATAQEAMAENSAVANRIVGALRAMAVESQDVRTSDLGVRAVFAEQDERRITISERKPRIIGYVATNKLEVRLRDLDRASAVIDAMIAAGANEVNGPAFSLADDSVARRQARQAAVAQAREEAEDYADALGMTIARVLRVSERSSWLEEGGPIVVTGGRSAGTPIEPGEIETHVTVWIDYALVSR
jgi:uncharacterized protein